MAGFALWPRSPLLCRLKLSQLPARRQCRLLLRFTATSSDAGVPGEFVVRWQSATGRRYTLQAATNLLVGFDSTLATGIQATPPENVHTDNVNGVESRYYRVRVEP